jgi:hypothetical protein
VDYRLRLISERQPETPAQIHSSNQMVAWGLWSELSKFPHITLSHYKAELGWSDTYEEWLTGLREMPEADFTLIHSYTPSSILTELGTVRAKTRQHVLWMSEYSYPGVDRCFTFLPCPNAEQVPLPALLNVLDNSLVGVEKYPGSVLLDHAWGWLPGYDNYVGSPPNLWLNRFYDWFQGYKGVVGQLESVNNEERSKTVIPDWVKKIPNSFFTDYLKLTAHFENYVMTHPGTYEHSIIDMAARGIRVLVPTPTVPHYHKDGWAITRGGEPFAPPDTIERLNLQTFSSKEELLDILKTPAAAIVDRSKFTDAPALAMKIDTYCQKVLNGCNG